MHLYDMYWSTDVVLLSECFTEVYPDDSRFEQVTAIIIVPPCTNSTVINHADYVMIQGGRLLPITHKFLIIKQIGSN